MGTPRLFQIFVVLGSAFMILLIIIYWDDEERYVPRREWKIHLTPVAAELQQRQVACTNWKRQSESVLQDGEPVADPGVISKGITHNSGAHLSLDRFWHRYGMFSRNNMKQLYKLYEPDFRLFGYERPDAILEE
ncbi:Carbohydrate sulfotransferase 12 [Merluccius polli]|uniref:Carbohydrate sulfotransferase 12 n=1 Tax=Merluccius polli TaxID=89951 RepID=A0AA47NP95_MERPO|nr:Carbohydrate sulfotransferase 12 [Merluccius polli]